MTVIDLASFNEAETQARKPRRGMAPPHEEMISIPRSEYHKLLIDRSLDKSELADRTDYLLFHSLDLELISRYFGEAQKEMPEESIRVQVKATLRRYRETMKANAQL